MKQMALLTVVGLMMMGAAHAQDAATANAAAQFDSGTKQRLTLMANDGLAKIMLLRPVTFDFDNGVQEMPKRSGLLASDVAKVFPEYVTVVKPPKIVPVSGTVAPKQPNQLPVQVDYARLTVPLIKAVQELKKQNDDLRAEFEAYKKAHP